MKGGVIFRKIGIIPVSYTHLFSEDGNIVILFDKYEAAPGYMGCPEFEIPETVYAEYLKDDYK